MQLHNQSGFSHGHFVKSRMRGGGPAPKGVKRALIEEEGRSGVEAIDPLIEKLTDSDWEIRLLTAAALETIGDNRGRDAIKPLMKDTDLVVRMRVERILAKWKKQPATT